METIDNQSDMPQEMQKWERNQKFGKVLGGVLVVLAGALLLLRETGVEIPAWIFSWKVIIILIGFVSGVKNGFSRPFWIFPVLVGTGFLITDFYPDLINSAYVWPVVLMIFGLMIMFKPIRKRGPRGPEFWKKKWEEKSGKCRPDSQFSDVDPNGRVEFNAILGGIQKNVLSKDFRGGEINAVLGGVQLNFSQADFKDQIHLEVNAVLGGVKLILPANWEVKSEINCVFGGVDDRRAIISSPDESQRRLLILEGNVFMGGIEIKSF